MKKILLLAMMASSVVFADKVAIVDVYKVLRNLPEYQKVENDLQSESAVAQKKLNAKKTELDTKINEIESDKDTLSDSKLEKARKEIRILQRDLKNMEAELREELSIKEQEKKSYLVNKAMNAVSDYAKKEGIDAVFSTEQMIYWASAKDMTDQIIKSLPKSIENK